MAWFGVRTLFLFGTKSDGTNVFEERVVCFKAASFDEAHVRARAEAVEYAIEHDMDRHPDQVAYEQDGENLKDGYEVWSELFESREDLESFWQNRYGRYEYHPEGAKN